MSPNNIQNLSAPSLLATLWRHKLVGVTAFVVVFAAVLAYTARAERTYVSEAKVSVRPNKEMLLPSSEGVYRTMSQHIHEAELRSLEDMLASRIVLDQVAEAIGDERVLNGDPKEGDEAESGPSIVDRIGSALEVVNLNPFKVYNIRDRSIKELGQSLKVSGIKDSNIISITYEATSPELARDVLDQIVTAARNRHQKMNQAEGAYTFFVEQTDAQKKELATAEEELRKLKDSVGIAALAEQRLVHVERIGQLETDLATTTGELAAAQAEVAHLATALGTVPDTIITEVTTGLPDTTASGMREQLYTLELQEKEYLSKYTEDSFYVRQIRQQIADAKEVLAAEPNVPQVTKGLNDTFQTLRTRLLEQQASIEAHKARAGALTKQRDDAATFIASLNQNEQKLAELERRVELADINYRLYAEKLEHTRIDQALSSGDVSNLGLLQPPSFVLTPATPRVLFNFAIGFVMATFAGLAAIVSAEYPNYAARMRLLESFRFGVQTPDPLSGIDGRLRPHGEGLATPGRGSSSCVVK